MKSKNRIIREMKESKKIHDAGKYSSEDRSSIQNIVNIIITQNLAKQVVTETEDDVTQKMKDLLN